MSLELSVPHIFELLTNIVEISGVCSGTAARRLRRLSLAVATAYDIPFVEPFDVDPVRQSRFDLDLL